MKASIIYLPSELVATKECLDHCNAAHKNMFGRIRCSAMSHGDGICLHDGTDLRKIAAQAERGLSTKSGGRVDKY